MRVCCCRRQCVTPRPTVTKTTFCCRLFAGEMEARGQCLFICLFDRRFDVTAVKKYANLLTLFSKFLMPPSRNKSGASLRSSLFFLATEACPSQTKKSKCAFYYYFCCCCHFRMFLSPEPHVFPRFQTALVNAKHRK